MPSSYKIISSVARALEKRACIAGIEKIFKGEFEVRYLGSKYKI